MPDSSAADGSADGGSDVAAAFLTFCTRFAQLRCVGARDCCTIADRREETCGEAAIQAYCEELFADAALHDGSLLWREAEAERHLAALEVALPECAAIDRTVTFANVLQGTLGEGEDCTPAMPRLRSVGRFRCAEGLRCELTGTIDDYAGRCAPPGVAGDSCNHDCAAGFYCRWDLRTSADPFAGRCQAIDESGTCTNDFACSTAFCVLDMCGVPSPADTWCNVFG